MLNSNKRMIKWNKGDTLKPFLLARSTFDQIMHKRNFKFSFTLGKKLEKSPQFFYPQTCSNMSKGLWFSTLLVGFKPTWVLNFDLVASSTTQTDHQIAQVLCTLPKLSTQIIGWKLVVEWRSAVGCTWTQLHRFYLLLVW